MSLRELVALIGTTRQLRDPSGMTFPVRVEDVTTGFGRVDLLVTPVGGTGQARVSLDRTTNMDDERGQL